MDDSVAGLDWAQTTIAQAAAADALWNNQKFFTALKAFWHHCEKLENAKQNMNVSRTTAGNDLNFFLNRQSMFGKPKAMGSSLSAPASCYNCARRRSKFLPWSYNRGKEDHLKKNCTQEIRVKQNLQWIIQKGHTYAPAILFELCTWAEESLSDFQSQVIERTTENDREVNEHIAYLIHKTIDAANKLDWD